MVLTEMIHGGRGLPLDGRPHLPSNVAQWLGDSRGHWEGDTLVVDTTNFTPRTRFRGSSDRLHVGERFPRTDGNNLLYRFAVAQPATWTKPLTRGYRCRATNASVDEYASQEGNYRRGS